MGGGGDISVENDNTVRIYFQNINSCGFAKGVDKWGKIIESMSIAECDLIIVAQTSVNWNILSNRNNMHDNIQHKMPIDKLITCRNRFVSEQLVLSGGTLQIVRGDWTGHVVATIQDSWVLGRWCGSKIRLKHDRHLFIICA
jgi:hypothetical protein